MTTTTVFDHVNDAVQTNQSLFNTSTTRVGTIILSGSNAINKNVRKIKMSLHKSGSPTGNATITIRDTGDNILASDTLNVTSLTTSPAIYEFDYGSDITLQLGYRLLIEYTGGNATNNIKLNQNNDNSPSGYEVTRYTGGYAGFNFDTNLMTFDSDPVLTLTADIKIVIRGTKTLTADLTVGSNPHIIQKTVQIRKGLTNVVRNQ